MTPRLPRDIYTRVFANLFNTPGAINLLLDRAGIEVSRMPFQIGSNPLQYWNQVLTDLENGSVIDGLDALVLAASKQFPGNRQLQEALGILKAPPAQPRDNPPAAGVKSQGCSNCDVFLSYASPDRACALQIAEALTNRGKKVWIDQWCLPPGRNFIDELDAVLRQAPNFAILLGPAGINPWHKMEIYSALIKYVETPSKRVAPIILKSFDKRLMPVFLSQFSYVQLESCDDAAGLERLILAL